MNIKSKFRYAFFLLVGIIVVLATVDISFIQVVSGIKQLTKLVVIKIKGTNNYRSEVISAQYGDQALGVNDKLVVVNTSLLPLNILYKKLPSDFALGGGAIASFNDKFLLMSRLGEFFVYDGTFKRQAFPDLNNGIESYLVESTIGLNSDTMRASYITYSKTRNTVYVSYNRYLGNKKIALVVSKLSLNSADAALGYWEDIFISDSVDDSYTSQAGAGKLYLDGDFLYYSVGYAEKNTIDNHIEVPASQNPKSKLGKIFKYNTITGDSELVSMGHRNVQGITKSTNGDILAVEQGPQGGDEINWIRPGKNFGWPYITYGTNYGSFNYKSKWSKNSEFKYEEPVIAFVPSVALSSIITVYDFHEVWNGILLAGSLKAQSLYRIVYKEGRVVLSEPIWLGHRVRDIVQNIQLKGQIAFVTDDGYIGIISFDSLSYELGRNGDGLAEVKLKKCVVCHSFSPNIHNAYAPNLYNIYGRKAGVDKFYKYSEGFSSLELYWSEDMLKSFLKNPNNTIPGTTMPKIGLSNDEISDIVRALSNK